MRISEADRQMKNILMISYYYPPLADVGSLRALGFSVNLPRYGWKPYVLSVKNPDTSVCRIGDGEAPENVKIYYARSILNLNRITWKINGIISLFLKLIGINLKTNIVHDLICFPDVFAGWIIPCLLKGAILMRKAKIDTIYVSCKPFSGALVGTFLKTIIKKPLIIDFRDPVSFPSVLFSDDPIGRFRRRIIKIIEQYTLKRADRVIVTTDVIKDQYLALYPFLKDKIYRIYNGFYISNNKGSYDEPFEKFTIGYSGNYYFDLLPRDIFFPALGKIVSNKMIPIDKLQFMYIGEIKSRNNWLRELGEKFMVDGIIVSTGGVSHKESLQLMSKISLLLLRIVPPMISTKLFEGLSIGAPLLATIEKGEVEQLIKKYSKESYIITSGNPDDVVDAIMDAYQKWEKGELSKSANKEYLEKFNKESLTGEFAEVLEQVLG
jgi:glycosyltransferase involved in cell wall biosynthesis